MIVLIVIFAAIAIYFVIRAISGGQRGYYGGGPMIQSGPMVGPVIIEEPDPIAEIATFAAVDVAANLAMDAFASGPPDPGFDQGGFDQGGFDGGGFDGGGDF